MQTNIETIKYLIPGTSPLLPSLLFESPSLSVKKIWRAPHPSLLSVAFTHSLVYCTTLYITATIAIAIFAEGIALCPCHFISIGYWRETGPEG